MDNGAIKKRDMKAPKKEINQRANFWWPLLVVFWLIIISIWVILIGLKKCFMSLFKKKKCILGKVVLITGAGRGLGRGISRELARLGAIVVCIDIHCENNEETVRLIRSEGGTAEAFTCNIAKSHQVEQLKEDVLAKFGKVDILVNNAALVMGQSLKEMTYVDIRGMYEVNCMGPAFMMNAFLPAMIERNSGHIVVTSSVAAMSSVPYLSLYCSTKSALSRFFDIVRTELDETVGNKIKVTIVHPYIINTSADYSSWFEANLPILEEHYAVKCYVDALLYEEDSIAVPSVLGLIKLSDALAGSYQYNVAMKFFGKYMRLPSSSDREQLPYAAIVSELSSISK